MPTMTLATQVTTDPTIQDWVSCWSTKNTTIILNVIVCICLPRFERTSSYSYITVSCFEGTEILKIKCIRGVAEKLDRWARNTKSIDNPKIEWRTSSHMNIYHTASNNYPKPSIKSGLLRKEACSSRFTRARLDSMDKSSWSIGVKNA